MRLGQRFETDKYFCCTCGLICRGAEAAYWHGGTQQGDPVEDLRLICTCCGTDHLARLFYRSHEYSLLLVRREHERIAITASHLEWHAKRQAERAVATLLSSSGSAYQKKLAENEQFLQMWQATIQPNIDLLPRKQLNQRVEVIWEKVVLYGLVVIFVPIGAIVGAYEWIVTHCSTSPAERRRKELEKEREKEQWKKQLQAKQKSRIDAVERNYREVGAIALPYKWKPTGRIGYIGCELDNPPAPDSLEDGLKQLACAGCGELGSLIYSFRDGMPCPSCKADTLEQSPEQREQNSAIWD